MPESLTWGESVNLFSFHLASCSDFFRSFFRVLLTNSLGKCMEFSLENLHVEIGA